MKEKKNKPNTDAKNAGQTPKAGVLGEHPVGAGLGAIGTGAAAGAAGGAIGGPVGAVAGAAVGAVVGGLAGSAAAEILDPTIETKYWKDTYGTKPYTDEKLGFDHYEPAYRYGWESFGSRGGKSQPFSSVESDLQRGWEKARGQSDLAWDEARLATKDAWDRVESGAHGCSAPSTDK